jgi:outer membrane lipoprotein-sorting protein
MPHASRIGIPPAGAVALALVMAVCVAYASCSAAAEPAGSEALLARIAAAHQAVKTIQGHATWRTRRSDEAAAEARVQDVRFFLEFPDHYCVVLTKPGDDDAKESVLSDGELRWHLQRQFKEDQPDVKVTPVGRDDAEFRRLLACFRMDLPVLRQDFTVTAAADGAGATVTLAPARPQVAEQVTALTIGLDAELRVTRVAWDDPQGNHIDIEVDQADYGKPIPAATFRWHRPAE